MLLVACANVANLFLVRSDARRREVAVRQALGAGRRALAGYFLAESVLLSIAGSVIGLGLSWGAVRLLVAFAPVNLPRLQEVRLDASVLAFTLALSLLTALAFGAIPWLRLAPLSASLHESGRGNTASRGRYRARHLLMGGQVALALVLVVFSGLMLRSFQKLRAVDPGFDARSALTFSIGTARPRIRESPLSSRHTPRDPRSPARVTRRDRRVRVDLPASFEPLSWAHGGAGRRRRRRHASAKGLVPRCRRRLLRGDGHPVAPRPVHRSRGRRAWRTGRCREHGAGRRALPESGSARQAFQVVDVDPTPRRGWRLSGSSRIRRSRRSRSRRRWPNSTCRCPSPAVQTSPSRQCLDRRLQDELCRARRDAAARPCRRRAYARSARSIRTWRCAQVRTLQDILDRAAAQMAFTMVLIVIAASVALMLGVIGIYGVMSYIVSQRTGEIGVRLALGAEPASVAGMIVRQGGLVALAGIIVGLGRRLPAADSSRRCSTASARVIRGCLRRRRCCC